MRTALLLLAVAALPRAAPLRAQGAPMADAPAPLPPVSQLIGASARAGDYLRAYLTLQAAEPRYVEREEWRVNFLELEAVYAGILGDDAAARVLADRRDDPPPPDAPDAVAAALEGATARGAVGAVVERARDRRVVMVNEAHHLSESRAFTLDLLEPLYRMGFRYLAVEALNGADTALARRGYPLVETSGFYTSDPVFGELIRAALRLGYTLVPYDVDEAVPSRPGDPYWSANERERIQARNIHDRTLARDPDARVLVHAGYAHVMRDAQGEWRPMALQFRELTGIDPLTVDQTVMTAHADPSRDDPVYREATRRGLVRGIPVALFSPGGEPVVSGFDVDLQVFHPRPGAGRAREPWQRLGGRRTPVRVAVPACNAAPCLVQAHAAGEGPGAVPLDQTLVAPGQRQAVLFLPAVPARIRVTDAAGRTLADDPAPAAAAAPRRGPASPGAGRAPGS